MSALKFAWENAIRIRARKRIKEDVLQKYMKSGGPCSLVLHRALQV